MGVHKDRYKFHDPSGRGSGWGFLVVQWLRLHTSNAGGVGSISGQGIKIPHATWPKKKSNLSFQNGMIFLSAPHSRTFFWVGSL